MGKAMTGNKKTAAKNAASASKAKVKKHGTCSKAQLLGVIGQVSALYNGAAPKDKVAIRTGYGNAKAQAFTKAISRLQKSDHIRTDRENIYLTQQGQTEAGDATDLPMSNEEAQTKIRDDLTPKMQEVFDLLDTGITLTRVDLAAKLKYNSAKEQGFTKLLSRMSQKGYLELDDDKIHVRLDDVAFPFGRDSEANNDD